MRSCLGLQKVVIAFLITLLFVIKPGDVFSQSTSNLDNLKTEVRKLPNDTLKVIKLAKLSKRFSKYKADTSITLGLEALELSRKLAYQYGEAYSLYILGIDFIYLGDYNGSIEKLKESFKIFNYIKNETYKARVLNTLGNVYKRKGNFNKAIENYTISLDISKRKKDTIMLSALYNNIALLYLDMGNDYKKSLEFQKLNLELISKTNKTLDIYNCLMNIGNAYEKMQNYDKAISFYTQSLDYLNEENKYDKMLLVHNMGVVYEKLQKFESAKRYYNSAIELEKEIGNKDMYVYSLQGIGNVRIKTGDFLEGEKYLLKSYSLAKEIEDLPKQKRLAYNLKSVYEKQGNYKESLKYLEIYDDLEDSIYNIDYVKQVTLLEQKFEAEKKQQQIELQEAKIEQQKTLKRALFGGLIALMLVIIVVSYAYMIKRKANNKTKRQKDEIEKQSKYLKESNIILQQQALSAQINPHFIFNTLNSIQCFIYENNKEASNKYLSRFSKLMRLTLDNSQHQTIPLEKELEALELYLDLELLRFENKFEYNINCTEDILDYKIPTLLIQPFVENALLHGIANKKDGKGKVEIDIKVEDKTLYCLIDDNGIGREAARKIRRKKNIPHKSLGTKITEKRLDVANTLYNKKMQIEYIDKYNDEGNSSGTRIEIYIPFMV